MELQDNLLDLSEGSKAMADIKALISRGVDVTYWPQNTGPVPVNEDTSVMVAAMAAFVAVAVAARRRRDVKEA